MRAIIPSDWDRFMIYAPRIKIFNSYDEDCPLSSASALEVYRAMDVRMEPNLLPNLQRLSWEHTGDDIFPFIRLFLTPHVRELRIKPEAVSNNQLSFLHTLHTRQLPMRDFEWWSEAKVDITEAIAPTLRGWTQLGTLTLTNFTQPHHLMHLPRLYELTMSFSVTDMTLLPHTDSRLGFLSLNDVMIHHCSLKNAAVLFEMMSNSPLRSLLMTEIHSSSPADWKSFLSVLSNHCDQLLFTDIHLADDNVLWPSEGMVSIDSLRPLLSFTNLIHVRLHHPCGFDLDDEDIKTMAKAWPQLGVLHIEKDTFPLQWARSKLTLQCLLPIAQYCTKIGSIVLYLDATTIAPVSPRQEIRNHSLVHLDVRSSPILAAPKVAAFLSDIFPRIETVKSEKRFVKEDRTHVRVLPMWGEVEDLISVLSKEERVKDIWS